MLYEGLDNQGMYNLLMELLSSARDINRRLDELKLVIRGGVCSTEGKRKALERVNKLIKTKIMLAHSIYDVRSKVMRTSDEDLLQTENLYKDLREL